MISPARVAAYGAGTAVSSGRLDLSDAVAAARRALKDDRDKTLAAEITIGVQRWRAALDHLIAHFAKRNEHSLSITLSRRLDPAGALRKHSAARCEKFLRV